MKEIDLLEQKKLLAENTAAYITSDICVCCSTTLGVRQVVLLALPITNYDYIALDLCPTCAEAKDVNRVKKGLHYWLNEGHVRKCNLSDLT